jgi:hypothetical protein
LDAGRLGERGSGSQETGLSPVVPIRGEDPEKEVEVQHESLVRTAPSTLPLWGWLTLALLLLALFFLLSASGALLAPLFGQAAGAFDYLHEFAHDGRHLLAVPCH